MKIKVIQTDIKMYSLVVSIIIQSLKEIGVEMSEYKPMFKVFAMQNKTRQPAGSDIWCPYESKSGTPVVLFPGWVKPVT